MTLKIFLDDKGFDCLKRSIPAGSPSKFIVGQAEYLNFFGSNTVISCDETEARNLLLYTGHCPTVIASINQGYFRPGFHLFDRYNENAFQNRFGDCDFSVFLLFSHNSDEFCVRLRLGLATLLRG